MKEPLPGSRREGQWYDPAPISALVNKAVQLLWDIRSSSPAPAVLYGDFTWTAPSLTQHLRRDQHRADFRHGRPRRFRRSMNSSASHQQARMSSISKISGRPQDRLLRIHSAWRSSELPHRLSGVVVMQVITQIGYTDAGRVFWPQVNLPAQCA